MPRKKRNIHRVDLDSRYEVAKFVQIGQGLMDKWRIEDMKVREKRVNHTKLIVPGTILQFKSTKVDWEVLSLEGATEEEIYAHERAHIISFANFDRQKYENMKYAVIKSPKGYHKRIAVTHMMFSHYKIVSLPKAARVLFDQAQPEPETHENASESTQEF